MYVYITYMILCVHFTNIYKYFASNHLTWSQPWNGKMLRKIQIKIKKIKIKIKINKNKIK